MIAKRQELNVDFIGGQGPLTKEEEQRISEYLKSKKKSEVKKQIRNSRPTRKRKVIA